VSEPRTRREGPHGQHGIAHLTVHSPLTICRRMIEQSWTIVAAAEVAGVHRQSASKWVRRFRNEGVTSLKDRSTRSRRIQRWVAPCSFAESRSSAVPGVSPDRLDAWIARSTVYAVLRRLGLGACRVRSPTRSAVSRVAGPGEPAVPSHEEARADGHKHGVAVQRDGEGAQDAAG
jgi:leucine-zipper of insertion element IS481